MDEIILTSLLYLIIICFLGHLIINYCLKPSIREGARTLPRPVIHPELNEPLYKFKPSPPYYGETLNQLIDRYIGMYFDKRGLSYMNTIQLYVDNCVNKGNVTEDNKSKLNDIGYYFLNIVIPNIQSVKNPNPEQNWPAIKWSGMNTFKVAIQPTPTYLIYKGQPYKDSYFSQYNSSLADNGGKIDPTQGGGTGNSGTGGTGGGGGSSADSGSGICDNDDLNSCGIGCPSSCLDGIAASWYKQQQDESSSSKDGKDGSGDSNNTDGSQWDDKNRSNIGNTQKLPGGNNNTLIIGSAEIDGYVITDEEQTSTETTLNDKINAFIKEFFIEKGPNKNRPTQKAIDVFNMYFQYRKPMDDIHMNKMRDVIYYILQVILPGLPTSSLPRSYVEWRPIVWLSLSERTKR